MKPGDAPMVRMQPGATWGARLHKMAPLSRRGRRGEWGVIEQMNAAEGKHRGPQWQNGGCGRRKHSPCRPKVKLMNVSCSLQLLTCHAERHLDFVYS